MALVEQVTIQAIIPSSQEIKELQNTVMKIEDLAERSEAAVKKIRESSSQRSGGVITSGELDDGKSLLNNESTSQPRVSTATGQNTTNAFRNAEKKINESEKKIKQLERKQKQIEKINNELKDKILDKIDLAGGVLQSGGSPTVLLATTLGRFGPIGILVASIVISLIGPIFKEFERGGLFSTKLRITEREKNIVDIDYVIEVRSGTKFITSDLRIAQTVPESSNTQNLKYEHIRYVSQELGV